MSVPDFNDRLRNINAKTQQHPSQSGAAFSERRQRPKYVTVGVTAVVMLLGSQMLKYVNVHYEAIRDSQGIGLAAGLGVLGLMFLLGGGIAMLLAIFGKTTSPRSQPQTSPRVKLLYAAFGMLLGGTACMAMFFSAGAKFVASEAARAVEAFGFGTACGLALLSVLIGLVGLMSTARAVRLMPLYFLSGGVLTFAVIRLAQVNVMHWSVFQSLTQ